MSKHYLIIHFWRTEGGFRKRIEMLIDVLQKGATVEKNKIPSGFLGLLLGSNLSKKPIQKLFYTVTAPFVLMILGLSMGRLLSRKPASVLIYSSMMVPFILMLRLTQRNVPVYYMVRGDEITYVKKAKRNFRAVVAFLFQKLLVKTGCHFVFVCEDLRFLFEKRLGPIEKSSVLPNTLGKCLPGIKPFDGHVALIGGFNTVKNIEWAIENVSGGKFKVHLYGNRTLPEKWQRPWLTAHGVVRDLVSALKQTSSLIVLPYIDAGFPNVVVEALEAECGVVVHRDFPFKYLPVSEQWRFDLSSSEKAGHCSGSNNESELESVLQKLLDEKRDFKNDNPELVRLVESDWESRVWRVFA
ncbi:MAG: glycosyltransferase [Planctomycetota bacterium]|jgi:hypothetical protein